MNDSTRPAASPTDVSTPDRPVGPLPKSWRSLPAGFLGVARSRWGQLAMLDSLGAKLTYGDVAIRALVLSRLLERTLGDERHVGLMLPPGAAGGVANLAVSMLGKVAVNLNYSASKSVVDSSIRQCAIRHVVTSPKAIAKIGYTPEGTIVALEDLAKTATTVDKAWAFAMAKFAPLGLLTVVRPGFGRRLDDPATVIFTSGSTGDPKGVVLTHGNVLWNVHQIQTTLNLLPAEVVLGVLPFFHSFGYTVAIWTVLLLGKRVVYHHSPLDYRAIANLIEEHGVTMVAASPTFMRGYLERAKPGQLRTLAHMLLGSERVKPELAESIHAALGVEVMEGYGCTELSPVVSVNALNPVQTRDGRTIPGLRRGTTGMPLPGTAIKTTDPDTGAVLPRGEEGLVWAKGPQVMAGYLNKPEETAKVIVEGWYCTGDLGYIDPDGFLAITGRLSRFAKVGGEMVPLEAVESAVQLAAGVGDAALAVTTIPDAKRGERLAVLYTELDVTPEEVCAKLLAGALPKLWLPSARDFLRVDEIPRLGVGKTDLRRLKQLAADRSAAAREPSTGADSRAEAPSPSASAVGG